MILRTIIVGIIIAIFLYGIAFISRLVNLQSNESIPKEFMYVGLGLFILLSVVNVLVLYKKI